MSRSIRLLVPAIAVVATLAWASSYDEKGPEGPNIQYFDKVAHFFVFGLLGTLWFRAVPGRLQSTTRLAAAFVLTLMYGVVDEWIQASNPVRTFDPWDWIADALGALTALLFYRNWDLYRRILETPVSGLFRGEILGEDEERLRS